MAKLLTLVGARNGFYGIFDFVGKHQVKARNLKKLKALGRHIRALRNEKGLTQEQLADLAGVSENTIVTLEAGRLYCSREATMHSFWQLRMHNFREP